MPQQRYQKYSREDWSRLRADQPLTLSSEELADLRGQNDPIDLTEVEDIYVPLTRLLQYHLAGSAELRKATGRFLEVTHGGSPQPVPFILGVAGAVSVGKSTTARILKVLLSRLPGQPRVDLVSTDSFLYTNRQLEAMGLTQRKGFPESYRIRDLVRFLARVKSGVQGLEVPEYSHLYYDILPDQKQTVDQPDVLIVEGLNVLSTAAVLGQTTQKAPRVVVSDFFDFSLYVDAATHDIETWYVERFLMFVEQGREDPQSRFYVLREFTTEELRQYATGVWKRINEVNLRENILPTRERAHLILGKGSDHSVSTVHLRRI